MTNRRTFLAGAVTLAATIPTGAIAGPLGDALRAQADDLDATAANVDLLEAGSSCTPPPPDTRPTKLIYFGNSVGAVRPGIVASDTFVHKIAASRGFSTYENMGMPNDHMSGMRARLQSVIDACAGYNAHVLVGEQINSRYYNIAPATYEADFIYIVETLLAAGIKVTVMSDWLWRSDPIIVTMQPYFLATYKAASVKGVNAFLDVYNSLVYHAWFYGSGASNFTSLYAAGGGDLQHPGAAGHTWVKDLAEKFPRACSLT
jgi:hypothetical protein